MNTPTRLLLVDDHAIVRGGIRLLLEQVTGLSIMGEAQNGEEALEQLKTQQPDVVLMDISLPGLSGIQTTQIISKSYKTVKVLMLSMHNNEDYILRAVEAGAAGYILKDSPSDEMVRAIRAVVAGEKYFSSPVANIILKGYLQQLRKIERDPSGRSNSQSRLSKKEKEVLHFLVGGFSSREIAEKLQLSVRTVDNHRANMMRRLQVRNAAELVRLAVEEKLV
jgi:DNA-binding NarL/FixJ family response regulator